MGFFKSTPTATSPPPPPVQPVVVEEKKGLFGLGRKKTVVRDPNNRNSLSSPTSPGPNKLVSPTSPTHGGVFNKTRLDEVHTQIPAAREAVRRAEEAEAQARAALVRAEAAVKEARRHVDALEAEAREQARLAAVAAQEANVKMQAVNGMKKQTDRMGRI